MDTYKLKFTVLQWEIFRLLCVKAGESLNLRSIAKLLKVSPTAVGKSIGGLGDLVKLVRSKTMNLVVVGLNRDSSVCVALKRVENLRFVVESGLSVFLAERFPGCTGVLFGSFSLGEDTVRSDVDIAIIGCKSRVIDLSKFEGLLERKINLQFYDAFGAIHKNLRNNVLNGITLFGVVEL